MFVVLWASGFVGARFGLQYAEPATLLSLRMVLNVSLFAVLIAFLRRRLPTGKALLHCAVVGVLIHGFYLGGTYLAIDLGMPAVEFIAGWSAANTDCVDISFFRRTVI